MSLHVVLTGLGGIRLTPDLESELVAEQPTVVGVASAFVSVQGVQTLGRIFGAASVAESRLVAGVDHEITHPNALAYARDNLGWEIRLGRAGSGIFHPKLIVGGDTFEQNGNIQGANFVSLGSANVGHAGFEQNVECTVLATGDDTFVGVGQRFGAIWRNSTPLTAQRLATYADSFARRNRNRRSDELDSLGVSDGVTGPSGQALAHGAGSPPSTAVDYDFAESAWAGLQSFTGDYAFQVEFPSTAGAVIALLLGGQPLPTRVDVYCIDEDAVRSMRYSFYQNNMFRLNIPNDVPGVQWARNNRDGIALIENYSGQADISLKILQPGAELDEVVNRSILLGTWARTSTRLYGWY